MKTVSAGVALLDTRLPGWREHVQSNDLDLSNCSRCVLGQIFGDYDTGLQLLGLTQTEAKALGFYRSRTSWERLTDAWRKVAR